MSNFVGVTGLPRAGSTLLCQLLAQHPDIHCEGHSSPLCNTLLGIRRMVSDDPFFLSQLDNSFDAAYGHLQGALQGFLRGWTQGGDRQLVVDKNRAWLHCIEFLLKIAPEAKLLVCLRDLGQIYASIENQHQKTILMDFIDHLADYDRFGRANVLFATDKVIGAPLIGLQAVVDLPEEVKQHLYFVRFEDLMANPVACMSHVYQWLGVAPLKIDTNHLTQTVPEADSHHHMKYLHKQSTQIVKPKLHHVPPRIQAHIEKACEWYYQLYYAKKPSL